MPIILATNCQEGSVRSSFQGSVREARGRRAHRKLVKFKEKVAGLARNLEQTPDRRQKRSFGLEAGGVEELANAGAEFLEHGRLLGLEALEDPGHAEGGSNLQATILLAHGIEQRLDENGHRPSLAPCPGHLSRQAPHSLHTRIPHVGVGILEPADDCSDDLRQMRHQQISMDGGEGAEEPHALPSNHALLLSVGVVQAVEAEGDSFGGQAENNALKVIDCYLLSIAIGQLVEGAENAMLELDEQQLSRGP